MSHNSIQRPALGQWAVLGSLYDARTDTFVSRTLLKNHLPETIVKETRKYTQRVQLSSDDTYKEKCSNLNIGAELGASYLSGMFEVAGAAEYLGETPSSASIRRISINYVMTTIEEKIGFGKPGLTEFITLDSIQGSGATHVLAAIDWGAQAIVAARYHQKDENDQETVKVQIEFELSRFASISKSGESSFLTQHFHQDGSLPMDIMIYSDALTAPGPTSNLGDACDFLLGVPSQVATTNDGRGWPLTYTLMPLDFLSYTLDVVVKADVAFSQPNVKYLEGFPDFFNELHHCYQELHDHYQEITCNQHCVPKQYIETINNCLTGCQSVNKIFRSDFGRLLKDVRSSSADQSELTKLLSAAQRRVATSQDIANLSKEYRVKIALVGRVMASGIRYLGYGAKPIEAEIEMAKIDDVYVLFFNDKLRLESDSWDENFQLMQNLMKNRGSQSAIAMVDCDATGEILERVRICRFHKGKLVVTDILDQIKYGKCVVRCIKKDSLDRSSAKRPLRRSALKIPCPGSTCDTSKVHDWFCNQCNAPVEYGAANKLIYCDCGQGPYNNYAFKCKELEHGPGFEKFKNDTLYTQLDLLDPMDELNILIIGETGVGKSTFINAFVNYLTYDSLDDAIKNEDLDSLIPCSFNYQTMDRSDPTGKIIQTKIQVGQDKDEADGASGSSATQKTTVYPFTQGSTVIRLIDTPGIGDTRGIEKDKENMANILGMLGNFDKLHGILFLLKSNTSRLNLMFRFVVEELLMHLHRDAAQNMVFGFTNTRVSNYMPGDTYTPLEALLKRHSRVHIGLSPRTVYCFDSESFRFLAAQKRGVIMDNIQDFRLSWEHSRCETRRLIDYFRSLAPHSVRSTLSLNQTRDLILHLTKPMADIMQSIDKTIQLNADNMAELKDRELKGDQLRERLHWERIELIHISLEHPRTVCNDLACKEYRDDGNGTKQTIYKSKCHAICYLTGIPIGVVSCSGLMNCAAFQGRENCLICGHHWENHLHVNHELEERIKTVRDEAIVEQITKNTSDIILKQIAIDNLIKKIKESKYEYKEIQNAAIRFAVFLQKHSITPYNDAMEDYLNHLIKEERGKVSMGGSKERLDNLERHLKEHVEQRKVLRDNIRQGSRDDLLDEAEVESLVDHLYRLKHWGANLRDIKTKAEADHLAEYREKPYRTGKRLPSNGSILSNQPTSRNTRTVNRTRNDFASAETSQTSTRAPEPYRFNSDTLGSMLENMPGRISESESTANAMTAARGQGKPLSLASKIFRSFTNRF